MIDAGMISDYKADVITRYAEKYPELVKIMIADREQAHAKVFSFDMPKELTLEQYMARQAEDTADDTVVLSTDGSDSFRVRAWFPRLIRKQILGSIYGDEPNTMAALGRLKPQNLNFNPKWFFYGGAYIYPAAAIVGAATIAKHGFRALSLPQILTYPKISRTMYIAARSWGTVCGLLAILILGLAVSRLYGPNAACFAIAVTSALPYFVLFGHLAKPYMTGALWAFLSLYWTLAYMENRGRKCFALSAIFAGLALASNYVVGFIAALMAVARFLPVFMEGRRDLADRSFAAVKDLVRYGCVVAISFLIVSPYWLFELDIVRSEANQANPFNLWNFGRNLPSEASLRIVVRGIADGIAYGINYPLLILSLPALALVFLRIVRRKFEKPEPLIALSIWALPFMLVTLIYNSIWLHQSLHYLALVAISYFVILNAAAWSPVLTRSPAVGMILMLLVGGYNVAYSHIYNMSLQDMKDRNREFGNMMNETMKPGSSVTTMLTVAENTDSFTLNILRAPQTWISATLPDFDFFRYDWRFRHHLVPHPSPQDADYIIDVFGDSLKPLPDTLAAFGARYELVAVRPRRHFVPASFSALLFPKMIMTYEYKDLMLWRRRPQPVSPEPEAEAKEG